MDWIIDNGKWLIDILINLGVAIGSLAFVAIAYRQIMLQWRSDRPQIDIKIEINEQGSPRLKIDNVGELSIEGVIYILIEPKVEGRDNDFSIIPDRKNELLQKDEFNRYIFAKIDFNLGANEAPYTYDSLPVKEYMEKMPEEGDAYFIRLESSYQSVGYSKRKFEFNKYYKLIPDQGSWTIYRINLDTTFVPDAKEGEMPSYREYKDDLTDTASS
ncbi:hypothetical protein JCM16358_25510 [Halanaerocella petrolearia]